MHLDDKPAVILLSLLFVVMLTFKTVNSILLLGLAARYVSKYEELKRNAEILSRLKKKASSAPASPRLSLIEFFDVMQQTNVPIKGFTFSDIIQRNHDATLFRQTTFSSGTESPLKPAPMFRSKSVVNLPVSRSMSVEGDSNRSRRPSSNSTAGGDKAPKTLIVASRTHKQSECESLAQVDRYTLCNDDRIES